MEYRERHEAQARFALANFAKALEVPEKWCCSGRCDDTNWGGADRLHIRWSGCPEFDEGEMIRLCELALATVKRLRNNRVALDKSGQ